VTSIPNVRAEVAVNPESRHIGTARSNGVLVTLTTPAGGVVSGLSAALMLDGWTWETMTLKSGAALNVNWPNPNAGRGNNGRGNNNDDGPDYAEQIRGLRDMFATARAYRDAQASGMPHDTDSRWEAMVPVVNGDIPVVVAANDIQQIQDAIAWAESERVRLVLRGAEDALYVADHLAAKQIPVLLTSSMDAPNRDWEGYDGNYGLAARLHEKGVTFAITGGASAPYTHRLPYEAGVAVAFGLPADEALRAVTIYPARIMGIDDRVGSLEVGTRRHAAHHHRQPARLPRQCRAGVRPGPRDRHDGHTPAALREVFREGATGEGDQPLSRQVPPPGSRARAARRTPTSRWLPYPPSAGTTRCGPLRVFLDCNQCDFGGHGAPRARRAPSSGKALRPRLNPLPARARERMRELPAVLRMGHQPHHP
jgi:hypothetical protein